MAKGTLFLPELEIALKYWEQVNFVAGNFFETLHSNPQKVPNYKKPLIGSELNEDKYFGRSIKDFKNFRKCIESGIEIDPAKFLPRVPTVERENLDQTAFLRCGIARTIAWYPYFLCNWLKYKRAYIIPSSEIIKEVSPEKKNFLSLLPYGAFLLKMNNSMKINLDNKEKSYNTVMISLDEKYGVIDLLLIPTNLEDFIWTEKEIKRFSEKQKTTRIPGELTFQMEYSLLGASFVLPQGYQIQKVLNLQGEGGHYSILDPNKLKLNKESEVYAFLRDKLNGFCKLISELDPPQVVFKDTEQPHEVSVEKNNEYAWNVVPITGMRNIKKYGGEIIISNRHSGGEKSPHWRRGHWHSWWLKDGTLKTEWLPQKLIRADKLETENLKGSATKLDE